MKIVDLVLKSLDKIQDVVRVVKALLSALETFTNELKKSERSAVD